MNERRRYFLRYIILYLCVLLPLLCASVFSNRLVTDALYSSATHQAQAGVSAVSDSLTTLYSEYTTASNFLTNYYQLSGRVMGRGSQEAAQGITFLNFANQFDSWTTDIFMSYGEEDVYSGKGLSRLTTLLGSTLQCTPQSILDAQEVVAATANATACLYSGDASGYLLMHFVTNSPGQRDIESVNYVIPFERLAKALQLYDEEQGASFTMTFRHGGAVTFTHQPGEPGFRVRGRRPASQASADSVTISVRNEALDVSIDAYFEPSTLYRRVEQNQGTNLLILIFGLLISVGLSCYFGMDRSRRVQQLEAFAKGEHVNLKPGRKDEFASLQRIIRHSLDETEQIYSEQKVYRDGFCRQLTRLLFGGMYKSRSAFDSNLSLCGIELAEQHYVVIGLRLPRGDADTLERRCAGLLSNELYYTAYIFDHPVFVFLREMPNSDENQSLRMAYARQLRAELREDELQIGFSRVYDDLMQAHDAYQDVERIFEQYPVAREYICRENLMEVSDFTVRFSDEELQGLSEAIERKDETAALELLKSMSRKIRHEGCTEGNRAYLRYSVTQAIFRCVQADPNGKELLPQIVRVNAETGDAFEASTARLIAKCCNGSVSMSDFERLLSYIREHYTDPSFSAEMAASFAGISTSYLSRLFKAKMGMTYIDYLTSLRMQRALELLRETKLPIKEIVEMVGYIDVSGFRRKFKSIYGISVADFRNTNAKESE